MRNSFPDVTPHIAAPLDPGFRPLFLANRSYREATRKAHRSVPVAIAIERDRGLVHRSDLQILEPGSAHDADTLRYVERHIKCLLWSHGGWKIHISGPAALCRQLAGMYAPGGERAFDADLMGRIYEKPFVVEITSPDRIPDTVEASLAIGGHLDGCRIGFDLGASDYKLAAVIDGEPVFSAEIPWQPSTHPDPAYHYQHIVDGLRLAASHMPRLDAIGGSAAGVYVNNLARVASLFRAIPRDVFERETRPMFLRIQKEFGVPLEIANDGDVTALAGAMSLKTNAILGVAMGSSQAGGYLNANGCLTGYLTELAFVPVDANPLAATDEWSGDIGVGAQYFSQQAVNKLAPAAGIDLPADMPVPDRLKRIQELAHGGHAAAGDIFRTIGVYLAYAIPHYEEYYDYRNMLVLGRVTSGRGGEILMETAQDVLKTEFPDVARRITVHVPDEKSRRVGQAVAAASLPEIKRP